MLRHAVSPVVAGLLLGLACAGALLALGGGGPGRAPRSGSSRPPSRRWWRPGW
ncbi:hypothetical protein [Kitasatospora albolonga]|uniref:hypothetical protein n=1 Tax=Kitasatospora albolonga TaxID=68173 RepID=UPI0031EC3823